MGDSFSWARDREEEVRQYKLDKLKEKNKSSRPTLEEKNKQVSAAYLALAKYPMLNGLSCNDCGAELYDTDGSYLTSYPPKTPVHCEEKECRFRGYRTI